MRCFSVLSLLFLGAIALIGCAEDAPVVIVAVASNTHCPIMGHEVADDGGRVEYDGKTVGFCCPKCIPKWNALSDEDKVAQLESPPSDDHEHGDGHDESDKESHEGHSQHKDDAERSGERQSYVCPMKCVPAQHEEGRCPVCSMPLVKADININHESDNHAEEHLDVQ